MESSRVVEVFCPDGESVGTGYLVTGDRVLTAWHVVQGAGLYGSVDVRALARDGRPSRWYRAAVIWPPTPASGRTVDAALLLVLPDPDWPSPRLVPVRWGRIVGQEPLAVIGLGFPEAARDPAGTRRDTLPLRGHIEPMAHDKSRDRYVLVGLGGPIVPARREGPGSPWAGASGTALFSTGTDVLLAVVTTDHDLAVDARTLFATPVAALAAADGFAAAVGADGPHAELVDVAGHVAGAPAFLGALPAAAGVDVPVGLSNVPVRAVFVGRAAELEELGAAMQDRTAVVTQAIAGLGGIGKSALAAEYAGRQAAAYTSTWWVTADSRANAETGLATLARRLCPNAAADPAELLDWAVSWLQNHPGWLLVWDNVDDPQDVSGLIATLPGGHHLVTSRRSSGWHKIRVQTPLRLGEMRPDDAALLLTGLAGPGLDADTAAELCAELGYLPLALEQAGAYLAEAGISGADYLALWRTAQARAVTRAPEFHRADRIMTGVWRITLDKLADTPLAGELLRVMAWLAPDAIVRGWLAPVAEDPDDLAEALRRLNAYSMISLNSSDATVSVHRVVQAVTRVPDATDPHRRPEAVTAAQNTAIGILDAQIRAKGKPGPEATAQWRLLLPHIDAFAGHVSGRPVTAETVTVMQQAYFFLHNQGNIAAAVRIGACVLAGALEHLGPNNPETLSTRNHTAYAYQAAGDLERAIPLFEQNLTESARVLGPGHPHTLASRNNLAGAYQAAGDLGRATPLLEQTLTECARVLGPHHPNTLGIRNNLAYVYKAAGDLERAIPMHEQNLDDRLRVLGPDHLDTLTSRNNLADAYSTAGDLGRAIPLFEQNLTDYARMLGQDHPSTLISRNNLANAYQAAGDLGRAILMHEQNLTDSVRVLGDSHPETLVSRNSLAYAYQSAGDLERAIPMHEQNLADRLRVLGPDHPHTLTSRNNLANAYQAAGDLERAILMHEQNLTDYARVLGKYHPDTLGSRNNLACAYQAAGDLGRAIPLYEQNLDDSVRVLGEEHPRTLSIRSNLAGAIAERDSNESTES